MGTRNWYIQNMKRWASILLRGGLYLKQTLWCKLMVYSRVILFRIFFKYNWCFPAFNARGPAEALRLSLYNSKFVQGSYRDTSIEIWTLECID